jgi:hypothetical protein
MANVFGSPRKLATKQQLFEIALGALRANGWNVERILGAGKSSVRRISRGGVSGVASIRTSQDTWIAFPRNRHDSGWVTLSDVDYVVAASVDNGREPRFAKVHLISAHEMRQRFDRAYTARKSAGHTLQVGRGVWVSLYLPEAKDPVNRVGAGAGLANTPITRIPLPAGGSDAVTPVQTTVTAPAPVPAPVPPALPPNKPPAADFLSIAEAKRRLALSLGVTEADIKITING